MKIECLKDELELACGDEESAETGLWLGGKVSRQISCAGARSTNMAVLSSD